MFLAYVSDAGRALVDREIYLPKSWTDDRGRCEAAGVPAGREFATKPQLARQMIARAAAAGVPFSWVTADEAYGQDSRLRMWLEDNEIAHVLAVPRSQSVVSMKLMPRRASALLADSDVVWHRVSAGDGAKGRRLYDGTVVPIRPWREPGWARWLLVRRSISDPAELAYCVCFCPEGTGAQDLIRVAGSRWTVEECFQAAKGQVGLDQYEVRQHDAWYRHITLAMAALAFLAAMRAQTQ